MSGSNMISLSLDMNYRILGELDGGSLILHRVVKHDLADRAIVNRNDQGVPIAQISTDQLMPDAIYKALFSFGVTGSEAERFRNCTTEDDLLVAASEVSSATANLALTLYETSGLIIPHARFRILQNDEDLTRILEDGGGDWELYLHPSQSFIVELPAPFRAAVVGSAGTGKTICGWHRTKYLTDCGLSVGFVCPNESALGISKKHLQNMIGKDEDRNYFFVPRHPDELLQLAGVVDHLIFDEAQEIPVTWLRKLSEEMPDAVGLTLFYDINQLGGNIANGDIARYRRRITDWKDMLSQFPRIQKFSLCINYRNGREIAEHYLSFLSESLPAKPLADVPVFEVGEVINHHVKQKEINDVLASLVYRLLGSHNPQEIGLIIFDQDSQEVYRALAERKLPVTNDLNQKGIIVTSSSEIRGYERQVIIMTTNKVDALRRNYGVAIDAYIAMSRAVKQLFILEVTT